VKFGEGRVKATSSLASSGNAGEVGACVFCQTCVRDMGAIVPTPKPGNTAAESTVPGVTFVRAAELSIWFELSLFLPARAGVSNLSGLVGA
jgi:hypothetical protein